AAYVRTLGMTILGRNLRVGRYELDIVARDGDRIVIVEVRSRGCAAWQRALDTLSAHKRRCLRRAAFVLWSRRWSKWPSVQGVRFDVASVQLDGDEPVVTYVRAAFT
ncbi:MAG TPA: YraN family protein, partial [Polyangiaceae bacterium]|nr:YraN family protein [Polyangiaceae bacterium]